MKEIVWFRRDLRIEDSAVLAHAKGEILPIFIFDTNILKTLDEDDKRVTFIYQSVLQLKTKLQSIGLDLAIFFDTPKKVFEQLKPLGFQKVHVSCDFDSYAIDRDQEIEKIIPMERYYDSFLFHPKNHLKSDETPYKVFTPFYKALFYLWENDSLQEYQINNHLELFDFDYEGIPTLRILGFQEQKLEPILYQTAQNLLDRFIPKIEHYQKDRDYFYKDGTSNISTHLRFGLISPRQVFNRVRKLPQSEFYIRELFWREFYNYILYHFPYSEFENFNQKTIIWEENCEHFKAWCEGKTGVPIVDAAMKQLNQTGMMHNRLRMIVASFFTKNLLLDWRLGEQYFAKKLLDYECSSNVGSWQWGASTGADAAPYFRIFNPYSQSQKFDSDAQYIKKWIPELDSFEAKDIHKEGGIGVSLFGTYPQPIVDCKTTRVRAIERFKNV